MSAVTGQAVRLAPDPALPFRDALLDEVKLPRILGALGADGRAPVSACRVRRINYQVGKSLRAVLEITANGTPRIVAARMFRSGKSEDAYLRALPDAVHVGELRGVGWVPDIETVCWVVPNDRKIKGLPPLLDGASSLPAGMPGPVARRDLVAYAPEKTATVACLDDQGRAIAYAKVAAAHQAGRDFGTYVALGQLLDRRERRLQLPSVLEYSNERRTLWLEAVRGRRMTDPTHSETLADLQRLGTAVALFHRLRISCAPTFDRFARVHLAEEAARIGRVRPDIASAAEHIASRLASTAPPAPDHDACLHGDLHPKNVIISDDRLTLIDLEDVSTGDAAADLGSVLAGLLYLRVSQRLSRVQSSARACEFLAGYAAVHKLPDRVSLVWHTAAALFTERAVRAVTRMRPLGLAWLPELIAAAGRLLDSGLEAM